MDTTQIIQVAPGPYITLALVEAVFGFTAKAVRRKVEEGIWVDGKEVKYAPDGTLYVSIQGVKQWVESGQGSRRAGRASGSRSSSMGSKSESA